MAGRPPIVACEQPRGAGAALARQDRRRIEQSQIDGIEAIDEFLGEELSLRENRRIKAALRMARLPVVKTLAG